MARISESEVEDAALAWFAGLGYAVLHGPDIGPEGSVPERGSYDEVLLSLRLGNGRQDSKVRTLFRDFINTSADVVINQETITLRFGRRTNNPFLLHADHQDTDIPIPGSGTADSTSSSSGHPRQNMSHQYGLLGIQASVQPWFEVMDVEVRILRSCPAGTSGMSYLNDGGLRPISREGSSRSTPPSGAIRDLMAVTRFPASPDDPLHRTG